MRHTADCTLPDGTVLPFPRTPFYMIRHGESVANLRHYLAGQMDSPLTPRGVGQAQTAAEIFAELAPKPTLMIASTLRRARETALIVNARDNLPLLCDRHLREHHYGTLSGRSHDLIRSVYGSDWHCAPPGGETRAAFHKRVLRRLSWWLQRQHRDLPVFVCHGGVFGALGDTLAGGMDLIHTKNCAVALFEPPPLRRGAAWRVTVQ